MKRSLLILLAICAFATAMIPRDRRAINTEEEEESTTTEGLRICDKVTPCAWHIYNPVQKIVVLELSNTYCVCGPETSCQYVEDDTAVTSYVYRCKPIKQDES